MTYDLSRDLADDLSCRQEISVLGRLQSGWPWSPQPRTWPPFLSLRLTTGRRPESGSSKRRERSRYSSLEFIWDPSLLVELLLLQRQRWPKIKTSTLLVNAENVTKSFSVLLRLTVQGFGRLPTYLGRHDTEKNYRSHGNYAYTNKWEIDTREGG